MTRTASGMHLLRRLTVVLTGLLTAVVIGSGVAAAAPADGPEERLTPKEEAGLRFAGDVFGSLLAGSTPFARVL